MHYILKILIIFINSIFLVYMDWHNVCANITVNDKCVTSMRTFHRSLWCLSVRSTQGLACSVFWILVSVEPSYMLMVDEAIQAATLGFSYSFECGLKSPLVMNRSMSDMRKMVVVFLLLKWKNIKKISTGCLALLFKCIINYSKIK